MYKRQQLFSIIAYGTLFTVSFYIFFSLIYNLSAIGDLRSHIGFAQDAIQSDGEWPKHFLYTLLLGSTSAFSPSIDIWNLSACFWLSVFICWKARMSEIIIVERFNQAGLPGGRTFCLIGALILVVVFPIPSLAALAFGKIELAHLNAGSSQIIPIELLRGYWYRHSFPPSVWHNSTLIILMPFALLSFLYGYRFLNSQQNSLKGLIFATTFSAFAKPSFLMAWLPTFAAVSVFSKSALRHKFLAMLSITVPVAIVLGQFFLLYLSDHRPTDSPSINFGWLTTWTSSAGRRESDFLIAVSLALLFPVTFYISSPRYLLSRFHLLALGMGFVSFIYAAVLAEGAGTAGNFLWSAISSMYILHLACLADLWVRLRSGLCGFQYARYALPVIIIFIEIIVGTAYIIRYVSTGFYY